jgi:hypothetical protein
MSDFLSGYEGPRQERWIANPPQTMPGSTARGSGSSRQCGDRVLLNLRSPLRGAVYQSRRVFAQPFCRLAREHPAGKRRLHQDCIALKALTLMAWNAPPPVT